ncbi:MAG: ABC transporter permease [Anaerolineales bacterium]
MAELQSTLTQPIASQRNRARRLQAENSWQLFRGHRTGMVGLALIAIFTLLASSHPLLMSTVWDRRRYDPIVGFDMAYFPHPSLPSIDHLLGTDNYGRDVLSQLLFGARFSFGVGLTAGLVAAVLSTLLGGAAGFLGGQIDQLLMGLADVAVLMPAPIVLLIFGLLVRMEWPAMGILYGLLTGAGAQAIIVKSQTLALRAKPYIEAAQAAGGGPLHTFRRHVLPGLLPLTAVNLFLTVVGAVLTESLLSYFNRTRVDLSWGTMIWLGQETFRRHTMEGQWHAILPPALAIMLFCSAFYLVGRALDEVLNPRLRAR